MRQTHATEDDDSDPPGYEAVDRTLYWTLSFYIPYADMGPIEATAPESDAPPIQPLRRSFDAQKILLRLDKSQNRATRKMREAVDPLFNDIADRTRQGEVFDRLRVDGQRESVVFYMPERIGWKTEGRRFQVDIPASDQERPAEMRRFWYLHSNGAMSWHVAFAVRYREQLEHELAAGRVSSLYFLSLLQKLAWPKESDATDIDAVTTDALLNVTIARAGALPYERRPFWAQLKDWFATDRTTLEDVHGDVAGMPIEKLLRPVPCIEVPGLMTRETRSLFFVQDEQFFNLIQPKTAAGALVSRRERILDAAFKQYPKRIREIGKDKKKPIVLSKDFWLRLLEKEQQPGTGKTAEPNGGDSLPGPTERVLYLFLAGFNQNIIDWANQEASEVLDSLDPIYPSSDEQIEEGFFIRYANPRSLITYVPQSRTLEVGNDHILMCPYAFLIHVLAMNNEHLTRAKEKRAFNVIDWVSKRLDDNRIRSNNNRIKVLVVNRQTTKEALVEVEQQINRLRIDSFEHFDRHRYANPFRYDTERDVFEELEKLRGTSRLEFAYKEALAALNEQVNDLERRRADDERIVEHQADSRMTAIFGLIGLSGVGQLLLAIRDNIVAHHGKPFARWGCWGKALIGSEAVILAFIIAVIGGSVMRFLFPSLLPKFRSLFGFAHRRPPGRTDQHRTDQAGDRLRNVDPR